MMEIFSLLERLYNYASRHSSLLIHFPPILVGCVEGWLSQTNQTGKCKIAELILMCSMIVALTIAYWRKKCLFGKIAVFAICRINHSTKPNKQTEAPKNIRRADCKGLESEGWGEQIDWYLHTSLPFIYFLCLSRISTFALPLHRYFNKLQELFIAKIISWCEYYQQF